FEVVETLTGADWREPCSHRVVKHWCDGLVLGSDLVCLNPTPDEVVCDEAASRHASLGPVEDLSAVSCEWRDPDEPLCRLPADVKAVDATVPANAVMLCTPRDEMRDYVC